MHKELIISIIIVIAIFGLNYISQKNTDNTVTKMKEYLDNTRNELVNKEPNYEEALKKANETYDKWEELDDIMALYIEHDELEKTKTAIVSMQSFVQMKDESQAIDAIDRCKYILDHIDEKEKFSIDNIF